MSNENFLNYSDYRRTAKQIQKHDKTVGCGDSNGLGSKTVIAIHGLAPKAPEHILKEYWYKALTDGILHKRTGKLEFSFVERNEVLPWSSFHMAYWADLMYASPARRDNAPYLKLSELGAPPRANYNACCVSSRLCCTTTFGKCGDKFREEVGSACTIELASKVMNFNDATDYWSGECERKTRTGTRKVKTTDIQDKLKVLLEKELAADGGGKEILLLAHSMGTMISYDVLSALGKRANNITFVTLGSPLGIPTVKLQHKKSKLLVNSWHNMSDLKDPICFDAFLRDDYEGVNDVLVCNNYSRLTADGEKMTFNNHKAVGYLQCPEVSDIIDDFLLCSPPATASAMV